MPYPYSTRFLPTLEGYRRYISLYSAEHTRLINDKNKSLFTMRLQVTMWVVPLRNTRKVQLTQRGTHDSDACVKTGWKRNLSSQLDIGWRLAPYPVHEFQCWLKIANFANPLSFSALVRGDPLRIYGKVLRFLKLESSRQPTVKIWWS